MTESDSDVTILTPSSTADVVDAVRDAITGQARLSTRRADPQNCVPESGIRTLDLTRMNRVLDYPARDMTITVEAGMEVSTLQATLTAENQQLPIDAYDRSLSVGALVASDCAGPRQFGYGTLRDYLIGIECVDGQGRIFHAGGRVVKNVAGYDLCRLMTGSRGQLGILTQLTFKLKPLPEHSIVRTFSFANTDSVEQALGLLNESAATPVLMDFEFDTDEIHAAPTSHSAVGGNGSPYRLHLGVEGPEATCDWQLDQLQQDCQGAVMQSADDAVRLSVEQYCASYATAWTDGTVRLSCPPSRLISIAAQLAAIGCATQGHAGNGIVYVRDETDTSRVRTMCEEFVARYGGSVSEWNVDNPASSLNSLSAKLRSTFDPHSVFAN